MEKLNIKSLSITFSEKYLFAILLISVFFWVIFKPSQVVYVNLYTPVYVLSIFSVYWFFINVFFEGKKHVKPFFIVCFSLTVLSVFSIFFSYDFDRRIMTNWPAWFCVLSLGYFLSNKASGFIKYLPDVAKVFLVFQAVIAMIQLFEPNSFDIFWSSDKTRGLDSIVRVTGSLYNPNFFAAVTAILIAFIVASSEPIMEWFWVVLGCVLILLSGSRTFIIGYPLVISSFYYLTSSGGDRYTKSASSLIALYSLTFLILFVFKDTLIYSARLLSLILDFSNPNDIANITSLSGRSGIWSAVINQFNSGNVYNYIFGSHDDILNPHNSYLYVLYKYGFIGLFFVGYLFFLCMKVSYAVKDTYEGKLLFMITLTIMGFGLTDISSVTMTFGIYLALILGITLYKLHNLDKAFQR